MSAMMKDKNRDYKYPTKKSGGAYDSVKAADRKAMKAEDKMNKGKPKKKPLKDMYGNKIFNSTRSAFGKN